MNRLIIALLLSLVTSVAIVATGAKADPRGDCVHDPVAGTFCGGPSGSGIGIWK